MTVDIDTLSKWRQSIIGDIDEIRDRLRSLEDELKKKQEELTAIDRLLALEGTPTAENGVQQTLVALDRSVSLLDSAHRVLMDKGGPLHYKELYSTLVEREVIVPGQNPAANLLAHIGRDPRFARVARGTYGLAEWGRPKTRRRKRKRRSSKK